ASVAAGLFAGAAVYVSFVEHPARVSCGAALAVREFGPSYRRGTVMQAGLSVLGCATALVAFLDTKDLWLLVASLLLISPVPYTLLVILPTNQQLLDSRLEADSDRAADLLKRWGRLHAVRTVLGLLAFVIIALRLGHG